MSDMPKIPVELIADMCSEETILAMEIFNTVSEAGYNANLWAEDIASLAACIVQPRAKKAE